MSSMDFIKTDSDQAAADKLAEQISIAQQNGRKILWLVSGGSAIKVAVKARSQLKSTQNITVMQVDERYGPVGHKDSNWKKLIDAGFNLNGLRYFQVLSGSNAGAATANYSKTLAGELKNSDYVIGLFGIGGDGHIAGIFANSPAFESRETATHYEGPDFERITITPKAIEEINAAVVFAVGPEKSLTINALRKEQPAHIQPAQLLKKIKDVYIYNDTVGGNA